MPRTKAPTIFIQIASYRDPELIPTLKDLLGKAKKPQNLVFSIAWQHSEEDEWDTLDLYKDDPRFKIIDIDYKDSKGACWARNLLQKHYDGETYTLQMDSHHRFVQDWDVKLIKQLKDLQKLGYKKPMITGYIPSYEPTNDPNGRVLVPWKMEFDRFSPDGNVHFMPESIDDFKERKVPVRARFHSAHFNFTLGQFVKEVPHDPEYYFHGEEISISVRAFTWGYDLFHPVEIYMWHYYTRKGGKRHWDDDTEWGPKNDHSHRKNRKLFGMDGEVYNPEEFGEFGFGPYRTLDEYERYAGISFSKRAVQQHTLNKKYPPNPQFETEEEYQNSFSHMFKHCIDIAYSQVPHDDYNVWAVAFEDENGNELCRMDADENEIRAMKNDPDGYCKLWRSFETVTRPYKWIVWPHSQSEGWVNRMEGILY
jgi:glycosyltransferase involved in cell wall biosynthesis